MDQATKKLIEDGKKMADENGEKWFSVDGLNELDRVELINGNKVTRIHESGCLSLDFDGYELILSLHH